MSNKKKKPIYQEDYDDLINSRGNDSPLSAEAKKALGQPDKNISKNGEKKTDYNSVKDSQRNKENLNTLSSDTQEFTNSSGKNNRSGEQNGKAFSKKENPIKGSVEKNPLGGKDFEKTYEKQPLDNQRNIRRESLLTRTKENIGTVDVQASKAKRGLDNVFSKDYKNYKIDTAGKENLTQFTNKELKYLNRDFKIQNKDNTEIKNEIKSRKIDVKALAKSSKVENLYDIKTDKGNIKVGVDRKSGDVMISTNDYKNNPNIQTWRKMEKNDLSYSLIDQGNIKSFKVEPKTKSINAQNVDPKKIENIQNEVNIAINQSQAKNHVIPINSKSLSNPEELNGKIISTKEDNKTELYLVINADKDNLTVQKATGNDTKTYMVNVKTEKENAIAREVQVTGLIDNKTAIGYNKETNESYVGTVKGKGIEWKPKEEFTKGLSPEKQERISSKLSSGDYRMANVTNVGTIDGGNDLYAAEKGNRDIVVSTDGKKWHNTNSPTGKALLELSDNNDNKIQAKINQNTHQNGRLNSERDTSTSRSSENSMSKKVGKEFKSETKMEVATVVAESIIKSGLSI